MVRTTSKEAESKSWLSGSCWGLLVEKKQVAGPPQISS
jgi:hypothetical protein